VNTAAPPPLSTSEVGEVLPGVLDEGVLLEQDGVLLELEDGQSRGRAGSDSRTGPGGRPRRARGVPAPRPRPAEDCGPVCMSSSPGGRGLFFEPCLIILDVFFTVEITVIDRFIVEQYRQAPVMVLVLLIAAFQPESTSLKDIRSILVLKFCSFCRLCLLNPQIFCYKGIGTVKINIIIGKYKRVYLTPWKQHQLSLGRPLFLREPGVNSSSVSSKSLNFINILLPVRNQM
jgi:hypothetical protein